MIAIKSFKSIFIVTSVFYLTFMYDFMQGNVLDTFGVMDELLVLILFFATIAKLYSKQKIVFYKLEIYIIYILAMIFLIGILSNFINNYSFNKAFFYDIVIFYKAFIGYFFVRVLFYDMNFKLYDQWIKRGVVFTVLVLSVLIVVDTIFKIFPSPEYRFGIRTYELFFGHPSRFSFSAIVLFSLVFPHILNKKLSGVYILFLGILSLRYNHFVYMSLGLISLFYVKTLKFISIKKILLIMLLGISMVWLIAQDQIIYHFGTAAFENGHARAILLNTSFDIAFDFFPFGSGFGTFASFASGAEYSNIYSQYYIDEIYGLSQEHSGYINDAYYAMLFGQFGFIGTSLFALMMIIWAGLLIKLFNSSQKQLALHMYSALLLIVYLVLQSLSDSTISQNRGVVVFFIIAIAVNRYFQDERNSNENTNN